MNALPTFAQLTSDKKILCIPCGIILKNRLIFNMKHCKDEQHISKLKEYLKQKNEKEEKKISEPKPIVDNDQESLKRKLLLHKDELLDENNDDDVQLPLGFFDKEKKGEDKRKSEIKKENNINVEEILNKEKNKIKKQVIKKLLLSLVPIVIILIITLFKLIPFGYDVVPLRYNHFEDKLIRLGVPKFSFLIKNNDTNYSLKNLRGRNVLINEQKNFLNTLSTLTCNNTNYYYDSDADITIIDYSVRKRFIYNTVSYTVYDGNYCNAKEIEEYTDKIGNVFTFKVLDALDSDLEVYFLPDVKKGKTKNEWTASLKVYYEIDKLKHKYITLEDSSGKFEIQNEELIYYRTKINEESKDIKIPNVSNFVIKNKKLILKDNYLSDYEQSIVLKEADHE